MKRVLFSLKHLNGVGVMMLMLVAKDNDIASLSSCSGLSKDKTLRVLGKLKGNNLINKNFELKKLGIRVLNKLNGDLKL